MIAARFLFQFVPQPQLERTHDTFDFLPAGFFVLAELVVQPVGNGLVVFHQCLGSRQFASQAGEAFGQYFGLRQQAFADPVRKGLILDASKAIENGSVFQLRVRVGTQQILGLDHALEGRQFAVFDSFLERPARDADQARGAVQGQQRRAIIFLI